MVVGSMKRIRHCAFLAPFLFTLKDKNAASFSPLVLVTPPQLLETARRPLQVESFAGPPSSTRRRRTTNTLSGWVERNGDWEWEEDDPNYVDPPPVVTLSSVDEEDSSSSSQATPKLPSGTYKPKQSLGQNYLKDPNTVAKILRAFDSNMRKNNNSNGTQRIIELGPGAGALTDPLVAQYGAHHHLHCIEIDPRSVQLLRDKHGPALTVQHADVLQVDYADLVKNMTDDGEPLTVIGNLPYYITSQILFALADAAHRDAVRSATVTMQWEVGQRLVARTRTKDYGILSVVFQLYCASVQVISKFHRPSFIRNPRSIRLCSGCTFCR